MRLTSSEFNVRLTPEAVLLVSPPSHSTVIHHKRASRYVVLGEISLSPFTTYIFVSLYPIHVKGLTQLSFLVTLIVSTG